MSPTEAGSANADAVSLTFASWPAEFAAHLWSAMTSPETLSVFGLCAVVVAVDFVRKGLRVIWPRRIVEGSLATIAIIAANAVFGPLVMQAAKGFQAAYDGLGVPRIDPSFWADAPAWALAPLAVLAYDIANYWNHRAMHMRWLWPVHAIHHSDPEITGLSTFRIHVLEALVMMGSYTLLLSWVGFPPAVLGGAAVVLGLHNSYQHVNVDWGHGPLRHVIASPRFHRWHHADTPEAHGKNLANVFPFLDVIFGTYYVPGRCDVALGAKGVPQNDVVSLLLYPFVSWARMIRGLFPPRRARAADSDASLA